jgi:serine/threonine-protein kinase RsbW
MSEPADTPGLRTFTYAHADDLRAVRAFVAACATASGLRPERAEKLTLAISELTTNTLQHTDGGGRVQVWVDDGQFVCEVTDATPADALRLGTRMPPADAIRGRGLAIVMQVSDLVEVLPAADGTRIQVKFNL